MIKKLSRIFFLIVLSLPLSLIILEVGIRIAAPQPVDDIAYEDIYTERYSSALNTNVMALVPGITRTKNHAEVHINSRGNRDYEYSQEKSPSVTRIAIVGSSVAFGFNLELEETFGKQLEKKLNESAPQPEYEVLLFGRPGFKAIETYAYIKDEILKSDPELIIYSFVQNNYEDQSPEEYFSNKIEITNDGKNKKESPSKSLLSKIRRKWNRLEDYAVIRFIRTNLHLYLFSTKSITNILRELSPVEREKAQSIAPLYPNTEEFQRRITNTEAWISLMNRECRMNGVKFAVLMHPYEMQLNSAGMEKWRAKEISMPEDVLDLKTHVIMKEFSRDKGFYFIDVVLSFRNYEGSNDNIFMNGDYAHYDVMGHNIIAKHLAEEMFHILNE